MKTMTEIVTALCNEHGHCYLDTYVAKAFAELSAQPESDILNILRRQERLVLTEESGRGRFERARERACMLLASGWDNQSTVRSTASIIAWFEPATAYGVLARREKETETPAPASV